MKKKVYEYDRHWQFMFWKDETVRHPSYSILITLSLKREVLELCLKNINDGVTRVVN